METTIPVSITIVGHQLIKTVTVAWSANAGMVPQALLFSTEGGSSEAQLTSDNPASAVMHYLVQVNFAIPGWEIIKFEDAIPVNAGGDRIVIDPGSWIHYLKLQFQIADDAVDTTDLSTDIDTATTSISNHLVVNLVWQTARLSHPVKSSQRLKPNHIWDVPYLCISPQDQVSATLSAFGVINQQMVRIQPRAIVLEQSKLALIANHNEIQLVGSKH